MCVCVRMHACVCQCVSVCDAGGISPEPFAMQGSFFIHPALTAKRHPLPPPGRVGGAHTQEYVRLCMCAVMVV